jgi:tetratricopeptide (TPR) repeat protein
MRSKLAIYLLLFVTPCLQASGIAKDWRECMSEGAAQSKAGKYSEAVLSFESALRIAGGFQSGGRRLLYTIDALASAYAAAGQFTESAYQYRRGLALLEKSGGRDSVDYALLLGSLAATEPESLDTNAAIPTLQRAITLRDASAGQVTSLRNYLFQIHKDQGQYQEAESVLLEEQADFEKRNETDFATQATLLNNLGLLRFNQNQYEEARVLYDKSLRIRESGVGSHSPDLIEPLNNLASSLVELRRFKDAGSVFQRATSLCRETVGVYHPSCGVTLTNYAVCLHRLGRKNKANQIEAEAKQVLRAVGRQNGTGLTVGIGSLRSAAK